MRKTMIALILILSMLHPTVFAEMFEGNFLDPFNNELFEVVAETSYYDDYNLDFICREKIYSDDFTQAKAVETIIYYDGTYEENELCGFTTSEIADSYIYGDYDEEYSEPAFNDGLTYVLPDDEYVLGGLKDINNNIRFTCAGFDYYDYSYNIGLLWECENNGYAGIDFTEREFKTTFTTILTDNKTYEFNCQISNFNDDGYSLMRLNGKIYVLKLKNGIIPTVFFNDNKISFDQIPVIENGRTLVPLRAIFETFGADIKWDGVTSTVTATKDDITVKLTINDSTAFKNDEAITLDVPAQIINGRTLVPVRFVSDCFDVNVEWDPVMRKVLLTK